MSRSSTDAAFTQREARIGSVVAVGLWLLSGVGVIAMIAWSTKPDLG